MCKYTLVAKYLDQLIEEHRGPSATVGNYDIANLLGSVDNPLRVLGSMCMDWNRGQSIEAEELAEVVGCSPEMLQAWTLKCDMDDAIVYAGRLALILLASLRNEALKYVFEDEVHEDALAAEVTLGRVLGA